jgi:hypothetical protein
VKPLDRRQTAFKAEEITYLDRKTISLDRMLLNLFELLRFDGRAAVRRRQRPVDVPTLVQLMSADGDRFPGFAARPEVAAAWLSTDLLDIMNRGRPGRETVVGPRPFHLNAFKLANTKASDYGASDQVWALLYHADRSLLTRLKEFFGRGLDPALDIYDQTTPLDLETLALLGLVDQVEVAHATAPAPEPIRPLCGLQGRLLAEDLRCLLAYEDAIPRHVLAGYLRTAIGLHLSLFMLRLFHLVPAWVDAARAKQPPPLCAPEEDHTSDPHACPFLAEIVLDLTGDPTSSPAELAKVSTTGHLDAIPRYVRAVILLNRLKDFASVQAAAGRIPPARSVHALLQLLVEPPSELDGFFTARIADVLSSDPGEEEEPIVQEILGLDLPPLEQYVELVCLQRLKNERQRVIHLMDSLTQKNRPGGFVRQTAGARSHRWFSMESHLLETLVQIVVVERRGEDLRSRPVLIDDFVSWLRTRYGFVIYAPAHREVPPEDHDAWRLNEAALRERLHQIGFFADLSDAYNSQTLRPRYKVHHV